MRSEAFVKGIATLCMLAGLTGTTASAQPRSDNHRGGAPERPGYVYDGHYNHNHYYPPRGSVVPAVPRGAYVAPRWRGNYYYQGGAWYRHSGPRFVVVAPPIGFVVPFLPPFYTTIWWGGAPYYYANDTYYSWRADQRGYQVVEPPPDAAEVSAAPASDDIFIYPRRDQTEQQQATDRYECHHWAVTQTGYDPTQPGGGVPGGAASDKRSDYHRAMTACLEARDYSVK